MKVRSLSDISISAAISAFGLRLCKIFLTYCDEYAQKILLWLSSKSKISPRKPYVGQTPGERTCKLLLAVAICLVSVHKTYSGTKPLQEFDPNASPSTRVTLAPYLKFGGRMEFKYGMERNFDLNNKHQDKLSTLQPALSLAISFEPDKQFLTYINADVFQKSVLGDTGNEKITRLELKEAFMAIKNVSRFSFQIGRQKFSDDRKWLIDDDFYALKMTYKSSPRLSVDLSVYRQEMKDSEFSLPQKNKKDYLAYANYAAGKKLAIGTFGLLQEDPVMEQSGPVFAGFYSKGEILPNVSHWMTFANINGKEGSNRINAKGFDVGSTCQVPLAGRPHFTLGYAFGTGDDNHTDNVIKDFRQTGFHTNSAKFGGMTRFNYYGELFNPELSNMAIVTGGIGLAPNKASSLDFVYHHYKQDRPAKDIRNSAISTKPTGLSDKLGQEIDIILGFQEIQGINMKLALGYFMPGKAFPAGLDTASFVNLTFHYQF